MKINASFNEYDLLLNISRGNEESFKSLFIAKKDKVFSYAKYFTHSVAAAEDITQEVFYKIWACREAMTEVQNIDSWIATVTRNLCFNFLKKKALEIKVKTGFEIDNSKIVDDVDDYISYKERLSLLDDAVTQLTPQQQVIFKLKKRIGMKNDEIAQYLNLSPNTVRAHLVVILKKLRHYLSSHSVDTTIFVYIISKFF